MANKKKPVVKATEEKVNEKATKKTSVDKKNAEEKKPLDKRFIIIGAIIVAIVVGVVVFLLVSGGDDAKNPAESSTAAPTADFQKETDEALWAEHTALFDELKKVYWLGEYENYKSLVPLAAWEAYAREEGVSLEEIYARAEQELALIEPSEHEDIRFYITKTTKLEGDDFNAIATKFGNMYDMEAAEFEEIYMLDVEVVATVDGERQSEFDTYYSVKIDGVRYLATDTGFVG